ncbi:CotO family spore coat protein [Metabacillus endolithicus]|uniref:CotO family spore coat protein n=1 Tax=Metabacillus endolithicus TaxID=1535204 RepID=A0ABW5C3C4_9BACI
MSNKQNYKMKPLMYIVSPEHQDIDVNMQSFVVKKSKQQKVDQLKETKSQIQTVVEEDEEVTEEKQPEKAVAVVEEEEQPEEETSVKQYRKQRKPITQMNIAEKVEFFTNLPKNMPRTLCQIETTEETYRGVIMTEEDNIVTIRSLTHAKPIDLELGEIKAINLLGF